MHRNELLAQRRAGVLLHITSLPDSPGNGDLGGAAYRFVDQLADAGFSLWQTLPVCPVTEDGSPYQSPAANAGNPLLIDVGELAEQGWWHWQEPPQALKAIQDWRMQAIASACLGFKAHASEHDKQAFQAFCAAEASWLEPYARFMALKGHNEGAVWWDWPTEERPGFDEESALQESMQARRFEQWMFQRQWQRLREHANRRGVLLFGDLPIFVAEDSAEVWSQPELFELGEDHRPVHVAGVPPDYFSETGQRWGNPIYDWSAMAEQGYQWWIQRMARQYALFDVVRIDHFRGFESYWAIPASCETAMEGRWQPGPGKALFTALDEALGDLPVVAEDLGIITPEVDALRHELGMPGMKILQFAFDSGPLNPYLPHNHAPDSVVYTGTHDNDTSVGWAQSLPEDSATARFVHEYFHTLDTPLPTLLKRAALASVAALCILPAQDVLALDSTARMNTPGTTDNNWQWRLESLQRLGEAMARLRPLIQRYGRDVSH